ncbi:MAG TPA: DUF3833 domain-containing protein [Roseateles sp.]
MNRRLLLTSLLLAGCASAPVPEDYAAEKPALRLESYFDGPLTAHGLFTDRAGKVKRRFVVQLVGRWQGGVGTLEEDFAYSDGKTERRVWTITALGNGRYRGTAADVVGAAEGIASGNALRWSYTLRLPVDGTSYDVQFDDWMFLMDERVMLNKARMSKFGFHVGDVALSFYKP